MVSFIIGLLLSLGLINNVNDYFSKSNSEKAAIHAQFGWVDDENGGI